MHSNECARIVLLPTTSSSWMQFLNEDEDIYMEFLYEDIYMEFEDEDIIHVI